MEPELALHANLISDATNMTKAWPVFLLGGSLVMRETQSSSPGETGNQKMIFSSLGVSRTERGGAFCNFVGSPRGALLRSCIATPINFRMAQ